jgi:hypothetical protein
MLVARNVDLELVLDQVFLDPAMEDGDELLQAYAGGGGDEQLDADLGRVEWASRLNAHAGATTVLIFS